MAVNTVAVVVAMMTLFLLHGGQSQSVTCFTGTSCNGANFSSPDSTSCCFGTGYSYNDGSSCQTCIVIGWKNASMPDGSINRAMTFRLEETYLAHTFRVGCLKGNIEFAVFNVGPETTSDYDIRPHQFTLLRCNDMNVNVFVQVDNIAMEQDEIIPLTLTKTAGDPFLEVFVINVIIIDSDVVNLALSEDQYSKAEGYGSFTVVVRQLEPRKTLDSDIVLRLIPVNYTYANNSGFYTCDEIPFDEDVPNRAVGGVDYDDSIVYCTFPAGDVTPLVNNRVVIYDDTVDEERQFFFVLLQVESATNKNRVKLITSITKCNIDDNDDMYLSFEFSSYSVNEMGTGLFAIYIIKQKKSATATENTYELFVQIKSRSSEMVTSQDFIANTARLTIRPNQEKVIYPVTILDDGIPEEEESFTLSISPITNEVQWLNGDTVTTIINIIDDEEIPVFGFVNPTVTVSEGIGIYIQNVTVYVPIPKKKLSGEFFFLLTSVDISASIREDYAVTGIGIFGGFNESIRDKSVRISITDDSKLEENEVFYLSLRRLSPLPSILKSSIATFIIMDNDVARVGLEKTSYTVDKNRRAVEICARVFEPDIGCPIDLAFELNFNTIDGSAVSTKDYIRVSTVLMFDRCAIRRCVNISIVDDTIPENTEYFTVMIGGRSNLHTNINMRSTKANITILGNDAIVVGYNKTNYITTEGQNVLLFAIIQPPGTRAIRPFTIAASISDDTAVGGSDYTPVMMHRLVFNTGDMYQSHTITILDDLECERNLNEHLFSDLVYVSGQMPINIKPNRATVEINDFNETECDAIVVGYNKTNYITTERQNVLLFAVIQPPGTRAPRPFTIVASTSDYTAVGGSDYTPVMMHRLVFNTGDMYQSHTITILDDLECERNLNEHFFSDLIYVSGLMPINIKPNRATVEINDYNETECELVVGFQKTVYSASEGIGTANIIVEIRHGTVGNGETVSLEFTTEDNTAINPSDYTTTTQTISFTSGQGVGSTVLIAIPISEDNFAENTASFFGSLSLLPTNLYLEVTPNRSEIFITDNDQLVVGFVRTVYSVSEGDGSVTVVVEIKQGTVGGGETVSVDFATKDKTATGPSDYTSKFQTNSFTSGQSVGSQVSISIPIVDDSIAEGFESFLGSLSLLTTTLSVYVSPDEADIFIQDDDNLVVGFVDTAYSVSEGDGSVNVLVEIKQGTVGGGEIITLEFTTRDNTATSSFDYTSTTQTLSFTSGQTIGTRIPITIPIVNDKIAESIESFFGSLSLQPTGLNVSVSPDQAEISITANCTPACQNGGSCIRDSMCLCPPSWSGDRCQTAECFPECENGGTCTQPGVCQCPQGWSGIRCSTAECVPFCQNGGNCSAPNVCKCPLGWSGNRCQTAQCSQGCENGGTCIIPGVCLCQEGWFGRRCEKAGYLGSFPCQPALTIGFNNKNTSVNEDNAVVTLIVEIQCGLLLVNQSIVVTLTLIDGSGSVGLDYEPLTVELVFNRTLTKHTVNVSLINDNETEQSETFFARLMLVSPLVEAGSILLSPNQIEVEIKDDDGPLGLVVGFAATSYTASEDDGFVNITVAVLQGTIERGETVSFVFTTQENNASAGVDYKTTTYDVKLTSGQGSKVDISIQIIDDDITESTESFSGHLMLLPSSRNVAVSSIRAEIVIEDNDNLTIGFVPTSYVTIEGVGLVVMNVVVLKGTIGTTVTLAVSTNGISSKARKDFEPLTNARFIISPKRSPATIAVRILNDNIRENWEAFTAHLSLVSPRSDKITIAPAQAVVLIVNDD